MLRRVPSAVDRVEEYLEDVRIVRASILDS